MMKSVFFYDMAIGRIGIADDGKGITNIFINASSLYQDWTFQETALIKEAKVQLTAFFAGMRKRFDLPLSLQGTEFQNSVWNALCTIPYGHTRTYKEIAALTGNPKASRAVGMANNKNPVPIIVPCHRVVGSNGKLVGYAGGLDMKSKLLDIEKSC